MMMVDKAVCTNDNQDDLITKTLKYEAVFSTLIENKVLAIKRECEEKNRIKRQKRKTFGRTIFGRKLFGGICRSNKSSLGGSVDIECGKVKIIDDVGGGGVGGGSGRLTVKPLDYQDNKIVADAIQDDDDDEILKVIAISQKQQQHSRQEFSTLDIAGGNGNGRDADKEQDSTENDSLPDNGIRNLLVEAITHQDDCTYTSSSIEKCEPINSDADDDDDKDENFGDIESFDKDVEISSLGSLHIDEANNSTLADGSITSSIKHSIESLTFPSSRYTVSVYEGGFLHDYERDPVRRRILEAKSISAQCSPILPSRQKHKLPSSVQLQPQLQPQPQLPTTTTTNTTTTAPSISHRKYLKSQVSYSDNYCRHTDDDGHNNNNNNSDPIKFFSRQNTSEDSANLTVSTLLNEADSIKTFGFHHFNERKSKSTSLLVISNSINDNHNPNKIINRLDSHYHGDDVNERFKPILVNYMPPKTATTTTSNYIPVIQKRYDSYLSNNDNTTPSFVQTKIAIESADGDHGGDIVKLQRMTSTSTAESSGPATGCCTTAKSKDRIEIPAKPTWPSGLSGSDDEYRKRKRKYKRYHRCSDPVLVYPSSGGLQHCILSMPPNQPIQFHYNEDFVYDMTLQVEADKNGDLQAIVPSHRTHKHRHHKHKKRHRHKKPKIVVHDLDTRRVKVIDPDDLPQRARWTIMATAFLLLLMCLMLVGITLRMAPIIDDMVRTENERLMHESMNRARLAKNYTDTLAAAASMALTAEEIP